MTSDRVAARASVRPGITVSRHVWWLVAIVISLGLWGLIALGFRALIGAF